MLDKNIKLINIAEAARFLGYKSTAPIKKLINQGKLNEFTAIDSTRKLVNRTELENLIQPYPVEIEKTPPSGN